MSNETKKTSLDLWRIEQLSNCYICNTQPVIAYEPIPCCIGNFKVAYCPNHKNHTLVDGRFGSIKENWESKQEELKKMLPCLFCNSPEVVFIDTAPHHCDATDYRVVCCSCGAVGPEGGIAAWNKPTR